MRQSHIFQKTLRSLSSDETSRNAELLMRAGFIYKNMAGVYSFLPLGLRVLQKVSGIIREEMNSLPFTSEILMPSLQSKELWQESGRWDEAIGDVMYTIEEMGAGLGPTHEEVVTDLARHILFSYKDVPKAAFQIQTKFRRELRAKSGLLRGREFLMKDLYSFHPDQDCLDRYYEVVKEAYYRVFNRVGLEAVLTKAGGGMFSEFSDEFQVVAQSGEDRIYLSADGKEARNDEIVKDETDPELIAYCGGTVRVVNAIEVGNIFRLGTKFSDALNARVQLADGSRTSMLMGCYGIGVSRLIGVIAEVNSRGDGLRWTKETAPFAVHLIEVQEGLAAELYDSLLSLGIDVLYDDRSVGVGEKLADADLIGIPARIVVGKKSLEQGGAEWRADYDDEPAVHSFDAIIDLIDR